MPTRKKTVDATVIGEEAPAFAPEAITYDSSRPAYATTNIYGPDGDLCQMGTTLPPAWPHDFITELLSTGGATQEQGE